MRSRHSAHRHGVYASQADGSRRHFARPASDPPSRQTLNPFGLSFPRRRRMLPAVNPDELPRENEPGSKAEPALTLMKCPNCQKHTSSFAEWWTSETALKNPTCPHCRQSLRVAARTWMLLVLAFALIPVSFFGVLAVARHCGMTPDHGTRKLLMFAAILPPFGLLGFLEWLTGTYRRRE
jgi:hypothetical protein